MSGPETEKARGPKVESLERGMRKVRGSEAEVNSAQVSVCLCVCFSPAKFKDQLKSK